MARRAERDDAVEESGESGPDERFREAKSVCLRLLAVRPRTRGGLAAALARKGFDEEISSEVLDRLERAKLIDDAEYAEMMVRSKHTHQGLGRKGVKSQLIRQGVDADTAEHAVSAIDPADEENRARELVRKRMRGMRRLDDRAVIRRLVAALARKGYAEGLAYRVVREELSSAGRDTDSLDGAMGEP
ncbi:regulatory protein RecX [Haloechinothrix salitolerans]|uniref:Regulatory protein RecX n=1 Tax=Haloechinothrix salitolerans TaxID=926830 RepID=A0ABW2C4W8_9PSEU